MDGNTLLQYARFREDKEGDWRIRRQQQVIKAISAAERRSIFKLPKAVGKLLGSIQRTFQKVCFWIVVWISSKTYVRINRYK